MRMGLTHPPGGLPRSSGKASTFRNSDPSLQTFHNIAQQQPTCFPGALGVRHPSGKRDTDRHATGYAMSRNVTEEKTVMIPSTDGYGGTEDYTPPLPLATAPVEDEEDIRCTD